MRPDFQDSFIGIVDDDLSVRRALRRLVESTGLRAECFSSPEDLLNCDRAGVACLVIDVHLPGMNGFELHRRIADSHRHVPVIFITAHPVAARRRRAEAAGAVAFLEKPFDDEELLEALERALWAGAVTDPQPI